jgi:hypothetical protein
MDEEVVEYRQQPSTAQQVARLVPWQAWMLIFIVVVGGSGFALWQVKDKLIWVGYAIIVVIGFVLLLIIVAGILWLVRQFRKVDIITVSKDGSYMRDKMTGKITPLPPLAAAATKPVRDASLKPVTVKRAVPKVSELLAAGILAPGMPQMLLGVREDITPRWGTLEEDAKTTGIGGRGRSGKTNTMFFFTLQYLFQFSEVWLADPHYNKPSGLTTMLGPLRKWVHIAGTLQRFAEVLTLKEDREPQSLRQIGRSIFPRTAIEEMQQLFLDAQAEIDERKSQQGPFRPFILIADEWNGILEDFDIEAAAQDQKESFSKTAAAIVVKIEREMAGYNMYCLLGVHSWMDKELGGTALRRLIHSVICHRMPADYSRHILPKKMADLTEGLRTGHGIFRDNEGYCEKLLMPYGNIQDAHTAAQMLEAVQQQGGNATPELPLLPQKQLGPVHPTPMNQRQPQLLDEDGDDLYNAPTIELEARRIVHQTGPLSMPASEAVKKVHHAPAIKSEEDEPLEALRDEDLADHDEDKQKEMAFTAVEEALVLQAAYKLHVETGKIPGRVAILKQVRAIVLEREGEIAARKWNRKKWDTIKAICRKVGL